MSDNEPKKLTPTQRLHELTMAYATRPPAGAESSVSLSRNAKGVAQFEVTVRDPDPRKAAAEAQRLFDMFQTFYPYPEAESNGGEK